MTKPKVTRQSIQFNGEALNLSELARVMGVDASYLSRIFAGNRNPSIAHARHIARTLGMGLDDFLRAIDIRRRTLKRRPKPLPKSIAV